MEKSYDAVVVGSGPNGLTAGIRLAQAGWSVLLVEGNKTAGGGTRSAQLTLPGYIHDVCSAILPLSVASPYLRSLPLEEHGLEWVYPLAEVAHPLDNGTAVLVERSLEATAEGLNQDGRTYKRLIKPLAEDWEGLVEDMLGPLPIPPRNPITMARFGLHAIRSATGLAGSLFRSDRARAMFAGQASHSILPLDMPGTAAAGMVMSVFAHTVGWPLVRGGSQRLADSLLSYFCSLGGEVITGFYVDSLEKLPQTKVVLFDVTPTQLVKIAGDDLPSGYRRRLSHYRHGPGVFKIDYALKESAPWKASEVSRAATVHVGGTMEEIAESERDAWKGVHSEKPFVLFVQQSQFDPSRAPQGGQTAWAYCHVPNGSTEDMTARIESQIERFAPGFGDVILARHTYNTQEFEAYNPNYIGGDIIGGVQDLRQMYFRPVLALNPYRTPLKNVYLCSSSTPPGGGVHGMSGFHAAETVLRDWGSK
jgi:phytoene dehydrogenase-like protein